MNGLEVAGAIVAGTVVVVASAAGTFYLLLTAETRRQKRARELTVGGVRGALDNAANRGAL